MSPVRLQLPLGVRFQAASWGVKGARGAPDGRRAGDDDGRGVDRTGAAWRRGEAKPRAMVTNDPRRPLRCERTGRIMMTSARCSWPRWRPAPGGERSSRLECPMCGSTVAIGGHATKPR